MLPLPPDGDFAILGLPSLLQLRRPMVLKDGVPTYVGNIEAKIKSWTGDDMETTTVFNLVV